MHHLLQLFARYFLLLCALLFVDELCLLDHIAGAEKQDTIARQSIASGAPGFLVVAFDVFWQIIMDDIAHVWLVDAHSERDRRTNHAYFVAQKKLLILRA